MKERKEEQNSDRSNDVTVLRQKSAALNEAAVTVVVSLYNYGTFLPECLDSVRAQTLDRLHLVVVDDHSTDDSADVAARWLDVHAGRFERFRLLRHVGNRGLARTRNTAFAHAITPFVFVLDADNTLYPRCLERLWAALQNCTASFAYGIAETFGEVSGLTNYIPWNPKHFAVNNIIDAMALLRKSDWDRVGGYSTDMPVMGWEDFDLWFKLARAGGWGTLVPEVLTRYRVHSASMLRSVTNPRVAVLWPHLRETYPEFFTTPPALPERHLASSCA